MLAGETFSTGFDVVVYHLETQTLSGEAFQVSWRNRAMADITSVLLVPAKGYEGLLAEKPSGGRASIYGKCRGCGVWGPDPEVEDWWCECDVGCGAADPRALVLFGDAEPILDSILRVYVAMDQDILSLKAWTIEHVWELAQAADGLGLGKPIEIDAEGRSLI